MLKDIARDNYQNGYNCAEAMLLAGNEYYNLDLNPDTFKVMAGFGGGVDVEDLCGVVSGSVALLGIIFVDKRAYESQEIKEITEDFVESFRRELKTLNCKMLKDMYREEDAKCSSVVEAGGRVLEEVIIKYKSK